MLGLYVGLLPHQTKYTVKFGNGTAERQFDLYVEPVSNSIDLIVIYAANIRAKFGGKFVKSTCTRTEMSRTGAFQADKKETNKDEAAAANFALAICLWEVQCLECSGRENSFFQAIGKKSWLVGLSMDLVH